MGTIAEQLAEQLATGILQEATDELFGRSKQRWAAMLVAAVAGIAIAVIVMRRRRPQASTEPAGDPLAAAVRR
jgi:hypothetical protein